MRAQVIASGLPFPPQNIEAVLGNGTAFASLFMTPGESRFSVDKVLSL